MRTLPVVQPEVSPVLSESGLLLRGVFALPQLPDVVRAALHKHAPAAAEFSQLLLFAHAGPRMWQAMHRADPKPLTSPHPIDEFSMKVVRQHLEHELGVTRWAQLYPGPAPVPLQELGALLGWHAPSPLRVGINATFGTWFAYRALVAADTSLPLSPAPQHAPPAPCLTCVAKPCLGACLGSALDSGTLALDRCVTFRAQPDSPCADRCPAREACPIAPHHRYDPEQLRYHYGVSLRMIQRARSAG
jgi:hypothetical protein